MIWLSGGAFDDSLPISMLLHNTRNLTVTKDEMKIECPTLFLFVTYHNIFTSAHFFNIFLSFCLITHFTQCSSIISIDIQIWRLKRKETKIKYVKTVRKIFHLFFSLFASYFVMYTQFCTTVCDRYSLIESKREVVYLMHPALEAD